MRARRVSAVVMLLITVCLMAACSGGHKLEGSTYYKVKVFDVWNEIDVYGKGLNFASDDMVIWETEDSFSMNYKVDGDSVIFESPYFGGVGEIVDDYEFPKDYDSHYVVNKDWKIPLDEKYQVIILNDEIYVKLDPSVFDKD